jgi:type IV pilus assembly protein PilA
MQPTLPRIALIISALALGACQKTPEVAATSKADAGKGGNVAVVTGKERSKNFMAVHQHLELGGTLYGYVDVDGDVQKLTAGIQALLTELGKTQRELAPFAQQDYTALAGILGLTDIKALGVSSVPDGTGYFRNRMFIYTAGERHGLMAGLGGKPGPFTHLNLAPADAAFYGESEMDLGVVYKSLKEVVAKVAGEPAGKELENALKKTGESIALSIIDLIYGLKGRTAVVVRVDDTKTMRFPGAQPLVLPAFSALACVDGIGPIVESALVKSRGFKRTESGSMHIFESVQPLPVEGLQPVIVIDGSTLYFSTSLAFLKECREQKTGLAQTEEFKKALAHVGNEGNGLSYVSPRLFQQVRRIEKLNPNIPPEAKGMFSLVMNNMPQIDRPLIGIRTNVADGILVRAYMNRSLKQDIAGLAIYNPVSVGLLAAMAIPAFQKVRIASQDKAVLNNLRQLSAAFDQYCLENGVTTATYDQLVGPTKYVRVVQPVAGENYRALRFVQGQPLQVRLADGRTIQYPMEAPMRMPAPTRTPTPKRGPAPTPAPVRPQP